MGNGTDADRERDADTTTETSPDTDTDTGGDTDHEAGPEVDHEEDTADETDGELDDDPTDQDAADARSTTGEYAEQIAQIEVLHVLAQHPEPVCTTADVATAIDCSTETARRKLQTGVDDGTVARRTAGANAVVWWLTRTGRNAIVNSVGDLKDGRVTAEDIPGSLADDTWSFEAAISLLCGGADETAAFRLLIEQADGVHNVSWIPPTTNAGPRASTPQSASGSEPYWPLLMAHIHGLANTHSVGPYTIMNSALDHVGRMGTEQPTRGDDGGDGR